MQTRIAVYAGSFDPITTGHLYVIKEALKLFDHVDVFVSNNEAKQHLFSLEERAELGRACLAADPELSNALVHFGSGYVVEYAKKVGAVALVRGLRNESDLAYEMRIAEINRQLEPTLPTVFLPTDPKLFCVSSGKVKELAKIGVFNDVNSPPNVIAALRKKFIQPQNPGLETCF